MGTMRTNSRMSVAIDASTTDSTKDQFADAFDVEDERTPEASSNPSECHCSMETWETGYPTDFC